MIIDSANILVRSGKGGDGCVAFHREKFVAKGGPSGGDGGDGGSIILLADPEVETLMDFSGRHHWFAEPGGQGANKGCHGKNGQDLIIRLPVGTLVYENPPELLTPPEPDPDDPDRLFEEMFLSGQERAHLAQVRAPRGEKPTGELLVDLEKPGMRYVIAKGGRGGFGNEHFKSATNQTPLEGSPGEPAVEKYLRLELKLIADVGLLGKPNAGKSTFLGRVSAAQPKIADYPFTTLVPQLGIADLGNGRRMVIADIPGLIEGAHTGQGLGVQFLKHVERTRLLLHLIDIDPEDGTDPVENYRIIREELRQHSTELADKPEVVVLSKTDLLGDAENVEAAVELIKEHLDVPVLTMSCGTGQNLKEVLQACWEQLKGSRLDRPAWDKPAQSET